MRARLTNRSRTLPSPFCVTRPGRTRSSSEVLRRLTNFRLRLAESPVFALQDMSSRPKEDDLRRPSCTSIITPSLVSLHFSRMRLTLPAIFQQEMSPDPHMSVRSAAEVTARRPALPIPPHPLLALLLPRPTAIVAVRANITRRADPAVLIDLLERPN